MSAKKYLFIEPYVHLDVSGKKAIVFNSLSKYMKIIYNIEVINVLKKIKENNNFILISDKLAQNIEILDLYKNYSIEIIPIDLVQKKPLILSHTKHLFHRRRAMYDINDFDQWFDTQISTNPIRYINLFMNNYKNNSYKNKYYSQYLSNYYSNDKCLFNINKEIEHSFRIISKSNFFINFNILGGNLYELREEQISFIDKFRDSIILYFRQNDHSISTNKNKDNLIKYFEKFNKIIQIDNIDNILDENIFSKNIIRYEFIINNEDDLIKSEKYINKKALKNYTFLPFYNGKNKKFFEKNIFVEENEFNSLNIDMQNIRCNSELNSSFWGILNIMPNNDVKIRINDNAVGNIYYDDMFEIIKKETNNFNGLWYLTREKVNPCKKCIYKFLCSPINNIELELKQYNTCKINI